MRRAGYRGGGLIYHGGNFSWRTDPSSDNRCSQEVNIDYCEQAISSLQNSIAMSTEFEGCAIKVSAFNNAAGPNLHKIARLVNLARRELDYFFVLRDTLKEQSRNRSKSYIENLPPRPSVKSKKLQADGIANDLAEACSQSERDGAKN